MADLLVAVMVKMKAAHSVYLRAVQLERMMESKLADQWGTKSDTSRVARLVEMTADQMVEHWVTRLVVGTEFRLAAGLVVDWVCWSAEKSVDRRVGLKVQKKVEEKAAQMVVRLVGMLELPLVDLMVVRTVVAMALNLE